MNAFFGNSRRIALIGFCLVLFPCSGCQTEVDPNQIVAEANNSNIKRLSNLYLAFQMKNNWKGPKNEDQFKSFLKKLTPAKLERIGIDSGTIDQLFVNERDGEPFKVRYSVPGSAMGSSEPVVFEATGVDGRRMVGFLDMQLKELEGAEYDQLWNSKIMKKAQPVREK